VISPRSKRPSPGEHLGHWAAPRYLASGHEHPRERDVHRGISGARAGPVDDGRTPWADEDVEGVEVEMEEPVARAHGGGWKEVRGHNLVQLVVEVCEHPCLLTNGPGRASERLDHGYAVHTLHHQVAAVLADLFDGGHGIALRAQVGHRPSLFSHRAAVPGSAQDARWSVLEDVGVATRREQRPGGLHAATLATAEWSCWRDASDGPIVRPQIGGVTDASGNVPIGERGGHSPIQKEQVAGLFRRPILGPFNVDRERRGDGESRQPTGTDVTPGAVWDLPGSGIHGRRQ